MTSTTTQQDQFYVFTMPGNAMCPVRAEMFGEGGLHVVAPTPFFTVPDALAGLRAANPGATVDELALDQDIEQAREWARTMPLEQISQ